MFHLRHPGSLASSALTLHEKGLVKPQNRRLSTKASPQTDYSMHADTQAKLRHAQPWEETPRFLTTLRKT